MTRAADSVSESVKSGALGLRTLAIEAGKAGAEATAQAIEIAERKLSEGVDEFAKTNSRTRKNFVKNTKLPRKELRKNSAAAREEALARAAELRKPGRKAKQAAILAAKSAGNSRRRGKKNFKAAKKDFRAALIEAKGAVKGERARHRRWPWLLGIAFVAAGTAYILRYTQKPPVEAASAPVSPGKPVTAAPETAPAGHNGRQPSNVPDAT
jgi:hypothetical protein